MNNQTLRIPPHLRLREALQRAFGRAPEAAYFDREGEFLGTKSDFAGNGPTRRAFLATALAAAVTSATSTPTQNNDSALAARRDELADAMDAIRPLVLQAVGTHTLTGIASAVIIDIEKGLLALSAHQAPAGSVIVLGPYAGHAVPELVFEARILNTTNAPEANGQDAALAQIMLDDPKNRQAYDRYINSFDGLKSPTLAPISPDRINEESQYFIAGYAGGTPNLIISRATPDFTDAPDAHLPGGLINECAYQMRVEDLRISQGGVSGGGMFEVKADGSVIYHGIITAVQGNDPSRPLFFTPISVLNTALARHGLQPAPRGQFSSCTPKPLETLINHRSSNRRGLIVR